MKFSLHLAFFTSMTLIKIAKNVFSCVMSHIFLIKWDISGLYTFVKTLRSADFRLVPGLLSQIINGKRFLVYSSAA